MDITLRGISYEKTMFIVSNEHEAIRQKIIVDLKRGGTLFTGKGLYNNNEKNMIYTSVSRREYQLLKDYIHQIDPDAFVTVIDANEVLGKGFKPLKEEQ